MRATLSASLLLVDFLFREISCCWLLDMMGERGREMGERERKREMMGEGERDGGERERDCSHNGI